MDFPSMVMLKVAVIDLLSSDPLIQTYFEFHLAKVVDATGTYLDGAWSKLRISELEYHSVQLFPRFDDEKEADFPYEYHRAVQT